MRGALLVLLLSACAVANTRAPATAPQAAAVREAIVEVVNASGRDLPAPRAGLVEEIARVTTRRPGVPFSITDAFAEAAAGGLRERGIKAVSGRRSELPVLRVAILDFEIRDHDTAAAVAFVSARYVLLATNDAALWEAEQVRLPIRLGGPDLTRSELARIAAEAVNRGLSSFPVSTHP